MSAIRVCLFGQFRIQRQSDDLTGQYTRRMQELLCYLLLHLQHPFPRETLAGLFYGDLPTAQSKKSFRQTLWQLQTALDEHQTLDGRWLQSDVEWVQLNPGPSLWLDVAEFDHAYEQVRGARPQDLGESTLRAVQDAVHLYRGDLLEGWYQDWCLMERERLQHMYLVMLDKLMGHCETCGEYEAGVQYGLQILRIDRAREHTHRELMRLYYLAGDRTGALHQYERCASALYEELEVQPAQATRLLYQQIKADGLLLQGPPSQPQKQVPPAGDSLLDAALTYLKDLQAHLGDLQRQLEESIHSIENRIDSER